MRRTPSLTLLTAGVLAGVTLAAGCSASSGPAKETKVALEGVGVVGDGPFVPSPHSDLRGVASLGGGGETSGDARGAFGGTRRSSQCDKDQLIGQLTADPVKAKAWAGIRGVDAGAIGPYVRGLTPVVLLHDTLVKNHNYEGSGRTYAYLSVLQAGVAVLVDPYGRPAVKCNCGNPLGSPDTPAKPSYQGARWAGFQGAAVTVIRPRPAEKGPLSSIPLVDPFERSRAFDRAVGNDGTRDSKPFSWTPPVGSASPGSPSHTPSGASQGARSPGSPGPSAGPSRRAPETSASPRQAAPGSPEVRPSHGTSSGAMRPTEPPAPTRKVLPVPSEPGPAKPPLDGMSSRAAAPTRGAP
ncbi:DUF6777 domain-containing protein [Streptomyces orinoci]|uniref:DUF6777 domain-containing protein n=1 Tax=Streptomyces orinoci TaxID=67339 RepID=A0ABV3JVC1_STRON|nr:DUF6777 domain-containing protein [Streptomyces orinoci]